MEKIKSSQAAITVVKWTKQFLPLSVEKQSPGGVLQGKVLLKISQISEETPCARVPFLIKLQAQGLQRY